mgnify:CR=1 FL=1
MKTPPALHATPASDATSKGPQLAQVAELLGLDLFSWQRQVADVALEVDEDGSYRYRTVGVSVGRQNGKTALLTARIGLELLAGGHCAYTAQDRGGARLKFLEAVELLRPALGSRFDQLRLANGSEALTMRNGGSLRVVTPSREGARGLTLDLVVIDEALAHNMELIGALGPTMATRPSAQLWMASNAGTSSSAMLRHYRDLGRAGDSPTLAWFEWAAAEHDDPDAVETWEKAIPTLLERHGVTIDAVRDFHGTMSAELFDREILNRWPLDAADYVLDVGEFARLKETDLQHGEQLALGVDISPMRDTSSIAIASVTPEGRYLVELVDHRPGVGWLPTRIIEIARRWNATVVIDAGAAAASLLPHLQQIDRLEVGARDYAAACGTMFDAIADGKLAHLGDSLLSDAVGAATRRRLGDRWAWKRTSDESPITPLVAASLAVWGAVSVPDKPKPMVH